MQVKLFDLYNDYSLLNAAHCFIESENLDATEETEVIDYKVLRGELARDFVRFLAEKVYVCLKYAGYGLDYISVDIDSKTMTDIVYSVAQHGNLPKCRTENRDVFYSDIFRVWTTQENLLTELDWQESELLKDFLFEDCNMMNYLKLTFASQVTEE